MRTQASGFLTLCWSTLMVGVAAMGSSTVTTYSSSPALFVPDVSTVTTVINVPDSGTVNSITLNVTLRHPQTADVTIRLTDPAGTTSRLAFNRLGGVADGLYNITFSDAAGGPPPYFLTNGQCMTNDTYRPDEAFSAFAGVSIAGNWTLTISDLAGADSVDCDCDPVNVGPPCPRTLDSWSLRIDYSTAVVCPPDVTAANDPGTCGANVTFTAPTTPGTVTCNHLSGSFFPVGATTVTCTSTNGTSCTFNVTVSDTESPAISAPADVTASAGPSCTASPALGVPVTSDNCPGAVVTNNAPGTFPLGTTTVTWTITDAHGHTATATQHVTVNDTTPPSLTVPANVTATAGPTCTATVSTGTATATDNCGPASVSAARSDGQPLAAPFPLGITTITWTAMDTHGNSTSAPQTVTVNAPPLLFLSATASPARLWPPNHALVLVTLTVVATGGCGSVTCNITSITSSDPVTGHGDHTSPDWVIVDSRHVKLRAERHEDTPRVYTITLTCVDGSGQSATRTVKVKVSHGEHDEHDEEDDD